MVRPSYLQGGGVGTSRTTEWIKASDVGSARFCPKSFELQYQGKKHSVEAGG